MKTQQYLKDPYSSTPAEPRPDAHDSPHLAVPAEPTPSAHDDVRPREYLYLAASGKATGPVSADELRRLVASGALTKFSLVCIEGTTRWVPLEFIIGTALLPDASELSALAAARAAESNASAAALAIEVRRKQQHIAEIRKRTCHGPLRSLIDHAMYASFALLLLMAIFGLVAFASPFGGILGMGLIFHAILVAIGVYILREIALVIIDTADTAIERNLREQREHPPQPPTDKPRGNFPLPTSPERSML